MLGGHSKGTIGSSFRIRFRSNPIGLLVNPFYLGPSGVAVGVWPLLRARVTHLLLHCDLSQHIVDPNMYRSVPSGLSLMCLKNPHTLSIYRREN